MAETVYINPTYIYKINGTDVKFYLSNYWSMTEPTEYTDNWYLLSIEWAANNRIWRVNNIKVAKGKGKEWRKALRHLAKRYVTPEREDSGEGHLPKTYKDKDGDLWVDYGIASGWQYHLQMMVTAEDRVEYLKERMDATS